MDKENTSPDNTEEEKNVEAAPASGLPLIRTYHRDVNRTQGGNDADDFTPTKPGQASEPQKSAPSAPIQEVEGIPEKGSGFVPPEKLHRVQETHANPERRKPGEQVPEKVTEKKPAPTGGFVPPTQLHKMQETHTRPIRKEPEEISEETPVPEPPPETALTKETKKSIVRTYEDDSARAIRENKGSVTSIAAAERKRWEKTGARQSGQSTWKHTVVRVISYIFILAGIGAISYIVWLTQIRPGTVEESVAQSFIFAEEIKKHDISNLQAFEVRNAIESFMQENISPNSVIELRLMKDRETTTGIQGTPISAQEFFVHTGLERRAVLARALGERIMIAAHRNPVVPQSILIADVASYDSAFASMIDWEKSIMDDLYFLLPPTPSAAVGTSTATSTVETSGQGEFLDIIIDNRDVRVLYDTEGNVRLLYSFPNTQTLVVSTDASVFRTVLDRLERRTFSH